MQKSCMIPICTRQMGGFVITKLDNKIKTLFPVVGSLDGGSAQNVYRVATQLTFFIK